MTADLAARLDIQDLAIRYAAAWDDRDADGFAATFAADGVLVAPIWRSEGHEALRSMVERARSRSFGSRHHLSNHRIRLIDADTAEADAYFLVISSNGPDHCGRYRDRLRRIDGQWLFAERMVAIEWQSPTSMWPAMVTDAL